MQVVAAFDERRRAEEHMRRFVADAGHGWRTPLSVITGYLEILRKGGADDLPTRQRAFTALGAEAVRMRHLVERLIALARLEQAEAAQPAVVDVADLVKDAIAAVTLARRNESPFGRTAPRRPSPILPNCTKR